jgi:uncharacterized protein YxjI
VSTALTREVQPVSLTSQSRYRIKRNFWSVFERTFRVFTLDGQLIMLVKHPVFRFREEFTVFADEAQERPLLFIKSRQIIAINFAFEVTAVDSGEVLGSVQKRGLRSIVRDKFIVRDPDGQEIGHVEERGASILRRFFPILTSKHEVVLNGRQAAAIRQIFRFFTKEFEVELAPGVGDPRFVMACALLALIAESRREDA